MRHDPIVTLIIESSFEADFIIRTTNLIASSGITREDAAEFPRSYSRKPCKGKMGVFLVHSSFVQYINHEGCLELGLLTLIISADMDKKYKESF